MSWDMASSIATIATFVVYIFLEWPKLKERFSLTAPAFTRFAMIIAFLCFSSGSLIIIIWLLSDNNKYLTLGRIGSLLASSGISVMLLSVIARAAKDKKTSLLLPIIFFFIVSVLAASGVLLSLINK